MLLLAETRSAEGCGQALSRQLRRALLLSVLLMCFGSLMIAVLPDYSSIGIAAPVLLCVARLLQGLMVQPCAACASLPPPPACTRWPPSPSRAR